MLSSHGRGSGVAIAAGHAHFVRSWVPKDRHPVGAAEGCGPRVRALGLRPLGCHLLVCPSLSISAALGRAGDRSRPPGTGAKDRLQFSGAQASARTSAALVWNFPQSQKSILLNDASSLSTVFGDAPLPAGIRWEHLPCITPLEWEAQGESLSQPGRPTFLSRPPWGCVVQFRTDFANLC